MTLEEAAAIKKAMDDARDEYYEIEGIGSPEARACLDGHFTADELEAMAVLMRAQFQP